MSASSEESAAVISFSPPFAATLGVGLERDHRGALALHDKQRHAQLRLRAALKVIEDGRNAAARAVLAHGGVPDVRKKQLFPRRKVLQTLHGGLDARAARGELLHLLRKRHAAHLLPLNAHGDERAALGQLLLDERSLLFEGLADLRLARLVAKALLGQLQKL